MKFEYTTQYRGFFTETQDLTNNTYWFELYINDPLHISKHFIIWKKQIDLLAPYRYSSIIYDNSTKKRKIKYIFDEISSVYSFLKTLEKNHPNLDIYWYKVVQ